MKLAWFEKWMSMIAISLVLCCVYGCDKDDSESDFSKNISDIIGTWGGNSYTSTGSNRTLIVTFYSDGTGEFSYESSVYYRIAYFTYTMKGDVIYCEGIIVGEDGNANDWEQSFQYHGNYLTPIGAYNDIKLYKEGYHVDDDDYSNGNNNTNNGGIDTEIFVIEDDQIFLSSSYYELEKAYLYNLQIGFGVIDANDALRQGLTKLRMTMWVDNGCFDKYSTSQVGKKKELVLDISSTNTEYYNWIFVFSKETQIVFNYTMSYYNSNDGKYYDITDTHSIICYANN